MIVNFLRDAMCPIDRPIANGRQGNFQGAISVKILLPLSVFIVLSIGNQPAAQAQNSLGNFGIPTASERFFATGTERFEREIQQLQERSDSTEDVLLIDPDVQTPPDLLQFEDPRIHSQAKSFNAAIAEFRRQ